MFNDWLLKKLQEMDWSQADLARQSGLTKGAISKYLMGRIPDETALRKIARAFKLPPETVFRAAGVLPPQLPENEKLEQAKHLLSDPSLTDEDKEEILEQIKLKIRIAEQRGQYRTQSGSRKRTAASESH
jgi:transcriptional regulator with XRE-family HTH domain